MSAIAANIPRLVARAPQSVLRSGLGCTGMSEMYGASDYAQSTATIDAALDAGVNRLDAGDFYGMGNNEMLVGQRRSRAAVTRRTCR